MEQVHSEICDLGQFMCSYLSTSSQLFHHNLICISSASEIYFPSTGRINMIL